VISTSDVTLVPQSFLQWGEQERKEMVKQRINFAVQIKVLLEPMNNPLGVSPSKGNQEKGIRKEKIF